MHSKLALHKNNTCCFIRIVNPSSYYETNNNAFFVRSLFLKNYNYNSHRLMMVKIDNEN